MARPTVWEDWDRDHGGWTKPLKLADDLPVIRLAITASESEPESGAHSHSQIFVVDPDHPLCPTFDGSEGFLGYGHPICEMVIEDNCYCGVANQKREVLTDTRWQANLMLNEQPEWLIEYIRAEIQDYLDPRQSS